MGEESEKEKLFSGKTQMVWSFQKVFPDGLAKKWKTNEWLAAASRIVLPNKSKYVKSALSCCFPKIVLPKVVQSQTKKVLPLQCGLAQNGI